MKLFEVIKMPRNYNNVHQSIYQSDGILKLVKQWLAENVPAKVILEIIQEIEEQEPVREREEIDDVVFTLPKELYNQMCNVIQNTNIPDEKRRQVLKRLADYEHRVT